MAILKDIIERRVNSTGVSEPVVVVQGTTGSSWNCPASPTRTRSVDWSARPVASTSSRSATTQVRSGQELDLVAYPPLFSGDQIKSASIGQDSTGGLTVDFVLKDEGAKLFAEYTADHVDEYFAIVLDGKVISAPVDQGLHPERAGPDLGRRASADSAPRRPTTSSRS